MGANAHAGKREGFLLRAVATAAAFLVASGCLQLGGIRNAQPDDFEVILDYRVSYGEPVRSFASWGEVETVVSVTNVAKDDVRFNSTSLRQEEFEIRAVSPSGVDIVGRYAGASFPRGRDIKFQSGETREILIQFGNFLYGHDNEPYQPNETGRYNISLFWHDFSVATNWLQIDVRDQHD